LLHIASNGVENAAVFAQTRDAVVASGAQIVTVAIRRTNLGQDANAPSLLDALPPSEFTYLPNSAGCYTADDAVRTLKLARELLDAEEIAWLDAYHARVRETLTPLVDQDTARWLAEATQPLGQAGAS